MTLTEKILNAVMGDYPNAILRVTHGSGNFQISARDFKDLVQNALDTQAVPPVTPLTLLEQANDLLQLDQSGEAELARPAIREAHEILEGKRISLSWTPTKVCPAEAPPTLLEEIERPMEVPSLVEYILEGKSATAKMISTYASQNPGPFPTPKPKVPVLVAEITKLAVRESYLAAPGVYVSETVDRISKDSQLRFRVTVADTGWTTITRIPYTPIGSSILAEGFDPTPKPDAFKEHLDAAVKLGELDEGTARYVGGLYDGSCES